MSDRIIYGSTKTYTHAHGLSCCFRQWKAESHCNKMHGYSLQVELTFEATHLDNKHWVVDFGGLKEIKSFLEQNFDHKTLVAADDPHISLIRQMEDMGIIDMIVVSQVGCEAFSGYIFKIVNDWVISKYPDQRVSLMKVEVREHGGNSAYVRRSRNV